MTESIWFLGARFNIIADATATGGKYDLVEGYFPSGIQTPPHRHMRYTEQVYVLEGEATIWAGEDKHVLHPGQSFLITLGTPHVVASLSDKPARMLVVASPSSFARLVAETGTLEETAPQDTALVERISAEIGDELLGAPGDLPSAATTT